MRIILVSMQKPRFKSRVMLLVRLMLKYIVGVIKMVRNLFL